MPNQLNDITTFEAVDFSLSGVIAGSFEAMNPDIGPIAFQRFLHRENKDKIFFSRNDDIQKLLHRIARHENDTPKQRTPELPLVVYYRETGVATQDINQATQVVEVTGFTDKTETTIFDETDAMRLTTIPLTLTYSLLFLAWDRPTLERMTLAWWGYLAPTHRKHSRFLVPYILDGEQFEIGASIISPREVATSSEQMDEDEPRLWGARTMCEVNTQAVYGAKIRCKDYFTILKEVRIRDIKVEK